MDGVKAIVLILLLIGLVIFGPLAFIWCLNTLFPVLAIPFTFKTWIAVLIIGGMGSTKFKSS